jgi:hypothetical protein
MVAILRLEQNWREVVCTFRYIHYRNKNNTPQISQIAMLRNL